MRTLLLGRKMKATDAKTIQEIGIPSMVLMERAAMAVAAEAEKAAKKDEIVWAVCGSGNNGADGIAAARMLHLKGYPVCIYMAGDENRGTVELKTQLSIARKLGISVKPWQEIETEKKGKHCCVIIDAVFGVGLGRPVEGNYKRCLDDLNQIREQEHTFCVAVDIPSGIHADTGAVMGTALKADVTVTFGWEKMGTALYPGRSYAGKVLVKDIGFPEMALEGEEEEGGRPERAFAYEKKDLCHIPERKADSNKGTFGKVLGVLFSIFIILALGFMGNMVQSNSIGAAFNNAFHVPKLAVGICVAVIAGIIFIGGIKRIASFTEKIVPIMALLYIIGCLVILVMHLPGVGTAFKDIFVGAFAPQAIAGGALGVTVQKAMRFGVARGLFSNEAGMGSTPHAHATAEVKDPCDQGIIAMMGVFIDTFIILTLTALVILSTGVLGNGQTGSELAQSAFNVGFGNFGNIFIALCMLFFAFTTIVGWYYFGEVNVRHLFGNGAIKVYAVIVVICVIIGSTLKVDLVWDMADMFNGLMVLPNLIALLGCLVIVRKLTKKSEKSKEKDSSKRRECRKS